MELEDLNEYNTELVREILIKDGYTVSAANTILSPGKYEGEHISTVYFNNAALHGFADITVAGVAIFDLSGTEKYWLSTPDPYFAIEYSDQGFVHGDTMTKETFEELESTETSGEE